MMVLPITFIAKIKGSRYVCVISVWCVCVVFVRCACVREGETERRRSSKTNKYASSDTIFVSHLEII